MRENEMRLFAVGAAISRPLQAGRMAWLFGAFVGDSLRAADSRPDEYPGDLNRFKHGAPSEDRTAFGAAFPQFDDPIYHTTKIHG